MARVGPAWAPFRRERQALVAIFGPASILGPPSLRRRALPTLFENYRLFAGTGEPADVH